MASYKANETLAYFNKFHNAESTSNAKPVSKFSRIASNQFSFVSLK